MADDASDSLALLADDALQAVQRDVNVLSEPTSDRAAKRRALEHIQAETLARKPPLDPRVLAKVFAGISKPVLRALADPVEKCRELAVVTVGGFARRVDSIIPFLPYIMPAFVARLGQPEIVEPSEEIRLLMLRALLEMVEGSKAGFSPFVEDTVKILARTLADSFPDVKKDSCRLVIELCKHNARPVAFHGDAVAKAILPVLHHRHSSVRTVAIEALGAAILVDAAGLDASLDTLRAVSMDKAAAVRETLYRTAYKWLMELIDRYTYGYKILPLLLSGMTDEMPKLRELSYALMDQVGALYEREWESRIKDEMDYSDGWNHLPNRPRVGSRHLARDNIQKIVGKLTEGMADWTVDTRLKSAQILRAFIPFTEDQITGYTGGILPVLFKILAGDDAAVMREAECVAQALGVYVDPDATFSILLPQLALGSGGATSFRLGCLRTARCLILDAPATSLEPQLPRIVDALCDQSLAFKLFMILAQLKGAPGDDKMPGYTEMRGITASAQAALSKAVGVAGVSELHTLFLDQALALLAQSHASWTKHSAEPRVLQVLLVNSGPAVGGRLDAVVPMLASCAGKERDYEVRERALLLLTQMVRDPAAPLNSHKLLSAHSEALIGDIVLPNCIWRAGRKAAILRGKSMALFLALLDAVTAESADAGLIGSLTVAAIDARLETDIVPVIISNMDDDEIDTRHACLDVISRLLASPLSWNAAHFKKLYPELLKRMDDAQDTLRVRCAQTWSVLFTSIAAWLARMAPLRASSPDGTLSVIQDANGCIIEVALDSVHWQTMVKGLVVHLDDTNSLIQECVCSALQHGAAACIPREVMREHLTSVRSKHRSTRYIDALLAI
ncbi:hypothetical protein HK105_205592 [Polyrhizophydium stewartii]|uniref:TOG domain-containing protein n=1 Tax=Polyrhizophydium stewartii TaxID=2732419 RepID=A0ABR4N5R9_9FUNG